jgi:hypothetical protein
MATPYTNTELFLANTTSNPGTINLPSASSIPGRVINFKDSNITFGTNALTLICNGSDTFEDGFSTKILKETGGIIQIVASGSKWYILTGTQLNSVNISSFQALSISTINISTASLITSSINFSQVSSIYSQSTLTFFNSNIFAGTRVWPNQNVNKYISTSVFQPTILINAVSTLSFWFDASISTSMIVSTNSTIIKWNTISTLNAVIVPQMYVSSPIGIISNAASYVPNILNGYGGVSCGTTSFVSSNFLNQELSFFTNSLNSEFTTFTLVNRTGTGNSGIGIQSQILSGNYRVALNGGNYAIIAPGFLSNINSIVVSCNVPTIIVGTKQGGNFNVRFNGSNTSLSNYSFDGVIANGTAYNFYIGNDGFGGFCPLIMYEILHYRTALATFDIQRVEGYLAWKWGFQSNLANYHPFRWVPPY